VDHHIEESYALGETDMDSASIAPIFHPDSSGSYFRDARNLREDLRAGLSTAYRLEDFSLFLVPSVRYGLLGLMQLLTSSGKGVALCRGTHYAPIEQLFRMPPDELDPAPDILITTHVDPYLGTTRCLSRHRSPLELVDASHSFATNLHVDLVDAANVFVAPLHKHAALAVGLAFIAVRNELTITPPFNMLELLEQATASHAPLIQALRNLDKAGGTGLFNKAAIGGVKCECGNASIIRVSDDGLALPFACFRHMTFSQRDSAALWRAGATYFPGSDTLRIARFARGSIDGKMTNFASDVQTTLNRIIQTR
jgi:hypothetical protein